MTTDSLTPNGLLTPLPQITTLRPSQTSSDETGLLCAVNYFVASHPAAAAAVAVAAFLAVRAMTRGRA